MNSDRMKQYTDKTVKGIGGVCKYVGDAVVELGPPAFKWTAVAVVGGFASVTVMVSAFFMGPGSDGDLVLGVLDRVERIESQQQAHRLAYIQAQRSELDAELLSLSENGDIEYCVTSEYDRIYLDSVSRFKEWRDDPGYLDAN